MNSEERGRLLEQAFAGRVDWDGGAHGVGIAVLHEIIVGLVFAQRPIRAAGQEAAQKHDLGPRGPFILSLIDRGIRFPKDLATVLGVGRSLVTAELVRLTEAGLVSSATASDRRKTELSLTPLGKAVNDTLRAKLVGYLRDNLSAYSEEQVALFAQMLRAMRSGTSAEDGV